MQRPNGRETKARGARHQTATGPHKMWLITSTSRQLVSLNYLMPDIWCQRIRHVLSLSASMSFRQTYCQEEYNVAGVLPCAASGTRLRALFVPKGTGPDS